MPVSPPEPTKNSLGQRVTSRNGGQQTGQVRHRREPEAGHGSVENRNFSSCLRFEFDRNAQQHTIGSKQRCIMRARPSMPFESESEDLDHKLGWVGRQWANIERKRRRHLFFGWLVHHQIRGTGIGVQFLVIGGCGDVLKRDNNPPRPLAAASRWMISLTRSSASSAPHPGVELATPHPASAKQTKAATAKSPGLIPCSPSLPYALSAPVSAQVRITPAILPPNPSSLFFHAP